MPRGEVCSGWGGAWPALPSGKELCGWKCPEMARGDGAWRVPPLVLQVQPRGQNEGISCKAVCAHLSPWTLRLRPLRTVQRVVGQAGSCLWTHRAVQGVPRVAGPWRTVTHRLPASRSRSSVLPPLSLTGGLAAVTGLPSSLVWKDTAASPGAVGRLLGEDAHGVRRLSSVRLLGLRSWWRGCSCTWGLDPSADRGPVHLPLPGTCVCSGLVG